MKVKWHTLHAGAVFGMTDMMLGLPFRATYTTTSFVHLFFFDRMYVHLHVFVSGWMYYECMYLCIIYVCIYVCRYVSMYLCIYICVDVVCLHSVCMHVVFLHAYAFLCVFVCMIVSCDGCSLKIERFAPFDCSLD